MGGVCSCGGGGNSVGGSRHRQASGDGRYHDANESDAVQVEDAAAAVVVSSNDGVEAANQATEVVDVPDAPETPILPVAAEPLPAAAEPLTPIEFGAPHDFASSSEQQQQQEQHESLLSELLARDPTPVAPETQQVGCSKNLAAASYTSTSSSEITYRSTPSEGRLAVSREPSTPRSCERSGTLAVPPIEFGRLDLPNTVPEAAVGNEDDDALSLHSFTGSTLLNSDKSVSRSASTIDVNVGGIELHQ